MIGCWIVARTRQFSFSGLLESTAVALPIGQAFGRLGCFLAGDDYGAPTDVPWALAFPMGSPPTAVPVHPTQLYELSWLVVAACFLAMRRKTSPRLFAEYMLAAGTGRFFVEFFRVNEEVALGLTE